MKRKFLFLLFSCLSVAFSVRAADTLYVSETQIPILLERRDNVLFYMRIDGRGGEKLEQVKLKIGEEVNSSEIQSIKLYYGGTQRLASKAKTVLKPMEYISSHTPGKTLAANPSYSVLKAEVRKPGRDVVLNCSQALVDGPNFFWISLQMKPKASLQTKVTVGFEEAIVNGKACHLDFLSDQGIIHRMGVGVRHAGDDGSAAFRIPGLVTSNKGTLLGVYDVRYNNSVDLQEHVDVGLSRSTNGGQTWEKMRIPLAFGETDGLPLGQNGVGDPAILVDTKTNTIWVVAVWTHGIANQRAWTHSGQGMAKGETGQLMLSKSTDDGKTWSQPINITDQVKDPSWYFLLQGPGRGITMSDGTLVFPIQYIDAGKVPNAGVMYSKDGGVTWKIHNHARTNTTEAQVAEVEPGVLMLNMRDNRGGSRAVSVTKDLGQTWTEHESSRKALQESVCMASLLKVKAEENVLNKDILLFSNPNTTKGRNHITIKASLDNGVTWLPEHQLLLDKENGWGYSCLTMIDAETVGILYESSVAHMTFQAVKLKDIIK